jgi:hypothetical protein
MVAVVLGRSTSFCSSVAKFFSTWPSSYISSTWRLFKRSVLLTISGREEARNSILPPRLSILLSRSSLSRVSCSLRFLSSSRSWASWTTNCWFQ